MIKRPPQDRVPTVSGARRAEIEAAVTTALVRLNRTPARRSQPPEDRVRRDRHGLPRDPDSLTLREGLRSLAHRNRRQLYPWLAMLATLVLGYTAAIVGWATGHDALVGHITTAVSAAAAAVLVIVLLARKAHPYWGSWLTTVAAAAGAWVTVTAYLGGSYLGLVALYGGTLLLGLRWWRHVRHPHATAPVSAGDSERAARLRQDWADNAAGPSGPVSGAQLGALTPYEHGFTGDIRIVRGRQSLSDIRAALPRLSTALDVAPENLIVEAHPDGPPSRLRLQIVTRSPIKQAVLFAQPVYTDGRILLGPYADGLGNATFLLYSDDSMESGYVLGSKGSGKSRVLETIALTAIATTPTVVIYLDGQNGASSPLLWEHALWHAGPDKSHTVLRSLLAIKDHRQLHNRRYRLTGFTPTPEMPGILVVIDECHKIFADHTQQWADLAREGRKLGIGLLAASQVATLDAFGNGAEADALRSSLVSSNGIALRTASRVQTTVFPGLSVDLMALPKLPGFGYTVDDGDDQHRTAPFRNRWLIGAQQAANRTLPDDVRTAEDWFATVAPRQQLDQRSAHAAGPTFLNRHNIAAAEQAELERLFDNPPTAVSPEPQPPTSATVVPFPQLAQLPEFQPAAKTAEPPAPAGLTDAQYAVWDTIARRVGNTAQIAETLALTQRRIQIVVAELVTAGHLVKTGRGTYATAAAADKARAR